MKINSGLFVMLFAFWSFGLSAGYKNVDVIVKQDGGIIEGHVSDYLREHDIDIVFPITRAIDTDYSKYFLWQSMSMSFLNISGSCKVLIVSVTSGKGYNQIYHHVAQSFESFKHPPYSDSSTWVQKAPVVAMDCDDALPGLAW